MGPNVESHPEVVIDFQKLVVTVLTSISHNGAKKKT